MSSRVQGTFDVKLTPHASSDDAEGAGLGRMRIDKRFHGDLNATSQGEMLACGTAVKGSAGYVALEKVRGTFLGREGTFVLQHSGTMNRGEPQLSVTVVPDSGTEQLLGLTGTMKLEVTGGSHAYDFEFTFAEVD